jgi:K+-transporting ATPase ATPase C chain
MSSSTSSFTASIRPSIVMTLGFTLLTGLAYPLAVTGVGQAIFPHQANGSIILEHGVAVGSDLIGQSFARPGYFHGRPSAAGKGYDASASSGSNLAPGSKELRDRIAGDVATLHAQGVRTIPADLVTTSASGLDPDVSPAAALVQTDRIARAKGLNPAVVSALVAKTEKGPILGFLGEQRVNILALNRQLDRLSATTAQ